MQIRLDLLHLMNYHQVIIYMLHFETIWNEAESVAKSFSNLEQKETLRKLRNAMDSLTDALIGQGSIADHNQALGDMLFSLCALCAHLEEKKGMVVNSAAALTQAIAQARAKAVDAKE